MGHSFTPISKVSTVRRFDDTSISYCSKMAEANMGAAYVILSLQYWTVLSHIPEFLYILQALHTEQTIKHTHSCLLVSDPKVAGWTSCLKMSAMSWHKLLKLWTRSKLKDALFILYAVFSRAHCRVLWFLVSSLQCPWGFNSLLPKSDTDLFICLHYQFFFLFGPIGNSWSVAQEDNREKKNHWEKIRVELSARQISSFASCLLTCLTDLWGCDCNALSAEGSQREDYKWQAESHYHSQFRGTQESQLVQRHNHNTQVWIFAVWVLSLSLWHAFVLFLDLEMFSLFSLYLQIWRMICTLTMSAHSQTCYVWPIQLKF